MGVFYEHEEMWKGAVDGAVEEKRVGRVQSHTRRGGLGLQRAIQRNSLAVDVSGYLICGCEIEPIAGLVGIERHSGSKALDGRLRISGNKCKVAPEPMAIVRISRREAHRALQRWQIRTRGEDAGGEFCAGQKQIDAGHNGQTCSELPTPPV